MLRGTLLLTRAREKNGLACMLNTHCAPPISGPHTLFVIYAVVNYVLDSIVRYSYSAAHRSPQGHIGSFTDDVI